MPFYSKLPIRHVFATICAAICFATQTVSAAFPDPVKFSVTVEVGNITSVRQWLDEGLDPNFMGDRIGTGLMIAAWEGNLPMMELFFNHGAQINMTNRHGEQALMHAAWHGHLEAVKWLVTHGAEINREGNQWSALHYAAFAGHEAVARYLIEQGANVNAPSVNGSTPLMMSAREGHEQLAQFLIKQGADASVKNDRDENALEWAMRHRHFKLAKTVATPEAFSQAAQLPPETFGPAIKSEPAPNKVEELMHQIRIAEILGRPTDHLRKALWAEIDAANREYRTAKPTARPSALVIRAKRGGGQESAELIYEQPATPTPSKLRSLRIRRTPSESTER